MVKKIYIYECLTTTTYTLRRFRGPSPQWGTGEDAGPIWQITRVAAVL